FSRDWSSDVCSSDLHRSSTVSSTGGNPMAPEPSDKELLARWNTILHEGDQGRIDAFLAEVDAHDATREARLTRPGALKGAAEWYAAHGIAVFRLQPRDKKP